MDLPPEAPLSPSHVAWTPAYVVGQPELDRQHQHLLAQCNRMADLCPSAPAQAPGSEFDAAFEQLKALVREHFQTEAATLAGASDAVLDGLRDELDEFEYLVDEIVTTENFDRLELQRFLSLWCLGHIAGTVDGLRAHFADPASGA